MITSEERPTGQHDHEERVCEFCGDSFLATHGLMRYCPEKYGIVNYCKAAQKKLVSENRLAEKVSELAKLGMKVHNDAPSENNKLVLRKIIGNDYQKMVTSIILDEVGYLINHFDSRTPIAGTEKFILYIGEFSLELMAYENGIFTFKITRL